MDASATHPSRREFLQWSAATIAAMHAPLLAAESRPGVSAKVEIHHTRLHANNLAKLAAYYRDVLMLPVEASDASVRVTAGQSVIEFVPGDPAQNPFYHFAFTIPENQLEPAMAWLAPRCPILNIRDTPEKIIHFKSWNAHSFYFNDPAGNILEFIVHHDLTNGVDGPFGPEHILWQSEIGLVVSDVRAAEKSIDASLGLTPYRPGSPVFSAVGDARGLLIVVKHDRIWLPTLDVHSDVFPTEVTLATKTASTLDFIGLPYRVESR
jgi:catechol-2,3-dioxygenase